MRRANELDRENADSDHVSRLDAMQQHVSQKVMLIKFAFRQTQREMRRVNRNVELFQDVRQRAQMIFMTVRENNGGDLVPILFEYIEIRNGNIDAIGALFGKAHAGIYDDHFVAKAQQRAIRSKLADAAERNNFEDVRHLSSYSIRRSGTRILRMVVS